MKKKSLIASLIVVLLVLTSSFIHKAYAGKTTSLNSPASFPVDI